MVKWAPLIGMLVGQTIRIEGEELMGWVCGTNFFLILGFEWSKFEYIRVTHLVFRVEVRGIDVQSDGTASLFDVHHWCCVLCQRTKGYWFLIKRLDENGPGLMIMQIQKKSLYQKSKQNVIENLAHGHIQLDSHIILLLFLLCFLFNTVFWLYATVND